MSIRALVERYYQNWVTNDRDGARAALADNFRFRSPAENCDGADEFMERCWGHAAGFDKFDVVKSVYDDESGYVVYRTSTFCCGEFLKVENGKISEICVTVDPTV